MEEFKLSFAQEEVRKLGIQFADLYFEFVKQIRDELGDDMCEKIVTRTLYTRAYERAQGLIKRAEEKGIERTWQNINNLEITDISLCGWVPELGVEHCPYGLAWNRRIEEHPWFRKYASLYCDVVDTTVGEVFTGDHSHKLYENVVLGDSSCKRTYFPDNNVKNGIYTYNPDK